jgi:hypothetical protein
MTANWASHPYMQKSKFLGIVPVIGEAKYDTLSIAISEKARLPVRAHECPDCHLVEFYHEDVSAPTQERQ